LLEQPGSIYTDHRQNRMSWCDHSLLWYCSYTKAIKFFKITDKCYKLVPL